MIGKKNRLLAWLSLAYGLIHIEGYQPIYVFHLKQGKSILQSFVDQQIITVEEFGLILRQMVVAGLVEDTSKVVEAVSVYALDGTFVQSCKFELCPGCLSPLPHGWVRLVDGGASNRLNNLEDGFKFVLELSQSGEFHPLDAVNVLQQMSSAGLPADKDAEKAMYQALPADVRSKVESLRGSMATMEVWGEGGITVLSVRLPAGLF